VGALVGEGGGQPDVENDNVGRVVADRILNAVAVAERGDDVVSSGADQSGKALA
jgi:hypothetical protein